MKVDEKIDIKYDLEKVPPVSSFHAIHYLPVILNIIIYLLFENLVVRSDVKKLFQMEIFLVRYDQKRDTGLFFFCNKPALI